jgi:hypothetical protein
MDRPVTHAELQALSKSLIAEIQSGFQSLREEIREEIQSLRGDICAVNTRARALFVSQSYPDVPGR